MNLWSDGKGNPLVCLKLKRCHQMKLVWLFSGCFLELPLSRGSSGVPLIWPEPGWLTFLLKLIMWRQISKCEVTVSIPSPPLLCMKVKPEKYQLQRSGEINQTASSHCRTKQSDPQETHKNELLLTLQCEKIDILMVYNSNMTIVYL